MKLLVAAVIIFTLAYASKVVYEVDQSIVLEYVNRTSDEFHRRYKPKFYFQAMIFLDGDIETVDPDHGRIRRIARLNYEFRSTFCKYPTPHPEKCKLNQEKDGYTCIIEASVNEIVQPVYFNVYKDECVREKYNETLRTKVEQN